MFSPVLKELDRWADAGMRAQLWLRDDDATEVTNALVRLAGLADQFSVPMLLAVVPEPATEELGGFVNSNPLLEIAVHGFRHQNHAPPGEKSIELGGNRPVDDICKDLALSFARLHLLFAGSVSNILVPPWNRIAPAVVEKLPVIGFHRLSTFGDACEAASIEELGQINTHLDIIDWKGSRGGRDPGWLVSELARLLAAARTKGNPPIGVLTHHLVHDAAAWGFLEGLFAATYQHSGAGWCAAGELT